MEWNFIFFFNSALLGVGLAMDAFSVSLANGLNEPKMKGIIFYELLDEPIYERDRGSYNGESHFGFIECDINGKNQVKKPAFYSLQKKIKEINGI